MKKEKLIRTISTAAAIVVMLFLIISFLIVFQSKMTNFLFDMTLQNIAETQDLYAESLQNKISDQIKFLEAQSNLFSETDLNDLSMLKEKAKAVNGTGDFLKLAIVNEHGMAFDFSGKMLPNMRNKDYFYTALARNESQIANSIELDEHLQPCLVITYPFKAKNGSKGVIAGFFSYEIMLQLFSIPIYSGQSYFYLITNDGNIILQNKDKSNPLYNIDFFSYIKRSSQNENPSLNDLKLDMLKKKSGYIDLNGVEGKKIFSYAPIKINNWYIISVLPCSYIYNQQSKINGLVFVLLAAVTAVVIVFIMIIYVIAKRNITIKKDNERLTIATNQAQTLIFEYDLQKQIISFSGDTHFILGTNRKSFPIDFIRTEYFSRVHPDDKGIFERLREALMNNSISFSSEFRYKDFNESYFWVKMTGSAILTKEGNVTQFIGSITNVNSQVLHEQELRNIAERDRLSYLLNKSAMQHKVCEYLEKDGRDQKSALIIIDLDNFKDVNDKLGHMTGDLAIKDAAKKLSLIFSDKDYLSRFGGDEFCVLMRFNSALTRESILKVITAKANDLKRALREDYSNGELKVSVSASIGIAVYPENGASYEELFKNADHALYQVKQNGKNDFIFYEE